MRWKGVQQFLSFAVLLLIVLYGCVARIDRPPEVSLIQPEDGSHVAVLASTKAVTFKASAEDLDDQALTFALYLGTSPTNLNKVGETHRPEYTVNDLTPGQTYYWKVVVSDGTNSVESPVWSFTVGENLSIVKVLDFTTGKATVGATVDILQNSDVVISTTTDENGHAKFYLPDGRYDVKITGEGRATSVVQNYDPSILRTIETLSRRAMTDYDVVPHVTVELFTPQGAPIPDPEATTLTFDSVKVKVTSSEVMYVMYIGLDYVPSAVARDAIALDTYEFTTTLSLTRFDNVTVPMHVVVYTPNDTRVDKIVYLTIDRTPPEVTARYAPTGLWYAGWTSDADVEYYSLPSPIKQILEEKLPKEMIEELKGYKPEHNIPETNIFVQLAWEHAPSTNRAGYNIYRSTDGENWEKVAFTTSYFRFDKGFDLEPGKKYYYTVRTVYVDGTESENSNVVEVVPLDLFKVKLISPADNETNVSRTPTFVWKPVDWRDWTSTPHIGGNEIPDEEITFVYYGPWIYDTAVSDQHIFYDAFTYTEGPQLVSLPFDPTSGSWIRIYPDYSYDYQLDPLEKFKTYEWGLDIAVAYYETDDGIWFSATIDYYREFDRWVNDADHFNRFTTGE
ncbi:carboxypeptidase regulatory-like domain-containing protein [Thermotoga caldifontis]|uniref:carboxypeptidase regulatory-like domain-containing protein n=1 Tax=Thermotoga caldifontis TaxID=1508419 RepID=UPI0005977613|nr:carboxypeptidase regulatory-like domain-containing protein [Thermotoga caldifontis]